MPSEHQLFEDKAITVVCISTKEEPWHISQIPFYCYTKIWRDPVPRAKEKESKERGEYI